jgi:hypothetical protein
VTGLRQQIARLDGILNEITRVGVESSDAGAEVRDGLRSRRGPNRMQRRRDPRCGSWRCARRSRRRCVRRGRSCCVRRGRRRRGASRCRRSQCSDYFARQRNGDGTNGRTSEARHLQQTLNKLASIGTYSLKNFMHYFPPGCDVFYRCVYMRLWYAETHTKMQKKHGTKRRGRMSSGLLS